jgi:hypothetical protein
MGNVRMAIPNDRWGTAERAGVQTHKPDPSPQPRLPRSAMVPGEVSQ